MTMSALRAGALACGLLGSTALTMPALAQSQPAYRNLDANGVDLTHGDHVLTFTEASLGSGETALDLVRVIGGLRGHTSWDRMSFQRTVGSTVTVTIGNGITSSSFSGSTGGPLTPAKANGETVSGGGGYYTHRAADGTVTVFGHPRSAGRGRQQFLQREHACLSGLRAAGIVRLETARAS